MKTPDAPANPKVRRRRQPDRIKAKILEVALEQFATLGFEGTSMRQIADAANTSLSLLSYHFSSKDGLWRAVMQLVFERSRGLRSSDVSQATATGRLRRWIANLVELHAEFPALHRLMTLECHKLSPRLIWIVENYTGEGYRKLTNLIRDAQKEGSVRDIDPARLRFAIMAMAAVPFSISAEYQLLTKKNPFSRKEIESTIELINELVFRQ